MSREQLTTLFETVRAERRAALMPFMTAGLPSDAASVDLFEAMAAAGADAFEVGIPYADPMMDGPTIQAGNLRSLRAGMTLDRGFEIVEAVARRTGKPVVVMTYANPIFRIGPAAFAQRCREAGAAAVIVADLPLEEAADIKGPVEEAGVGMVLFAAPTASDERLESIAATRPIFIYGIADLGVTGERTGSRDRARRLAGRIRAVTDVPLVAGVGISTPEQAGSLAPLVDGIIVGSALVRRALEGTDDSAAINSVGAAVRELAGAVR